MCIIELTNDEIKTLKKIAKLLYNNPSTDQELFCKEAKTLSSFIPLRIKHELVKFANHGSETGFIIIKTINMENISLPITPPKNYYKIGEKTLLAKIQSILIQFFSEMIAYEAECYGQLFQDVVPIKNMAKNQTSMGSEVELEIHTEQAFSDLRPDYLSLACLRGDDNAFTYILPIKYIIDNVSKEEFEILRKPNWKTDVDLSFKINGHQFIKGDTRGPMPIINGELGNLNLQFDQDLMKGIDDDSEKMVLKITDIYYKHRIAYNLKKGEIIFIDNRRAVHGRSTFYPKFDGNDRFLIRCFSTLDLNKSAYARKNDGRTVSAIYS
uniref:TauD/TfdA-like domain-containing protein n=1 Tax=viral metagenome TaxID=1070528 RepID=A0A6C0JE68_9ZZZZ